MTRYEWISHICDLISEMMKWFDLKVWYGPAHPAEREFVGKRKHSELKQPASFHCCAFSRLNAISLFAFFYPFFQPPLRVIRPLTRSRSALYSNNEAMWRKSLRLFQLPSLQDVKTLNGQTTWLKQHCFGIRYITKVTYDDPLYSHSLWLLV